MTLPIEELVSLAVFAQVVECNSFTTAASKLGLSKSVVSSKVAQLESKMGVRLLHRSTRRVSITPDGAALYASCSRLLKAADEAAHVVGQMGAALEGMVRVTFPVGLSLHMPKLIEGFIVKYPAIQLELSSNDRHLDLVTEGFDLGIRVTSAVKDNALSVRRIGTERVIVCAAPRYLERHGRPVKPADLKQHRCLRSSLHSADWKLDADDQAVTVKVTGNLISDNAAILLQAAIDGLGIALLPMSFVSADLESGRLVRILENYSTASFNVFLVHPYQRQVPPKVRVLIEHLVQQMQTSERSPLETGRKKPKRRMN